MKTFWLCENEDTLSFLEESDGEENNKEKCGEEKNSGRVPAMPSKSVLVTNL